MRAANTGILLVLLVLFLGCTENDDATVLKLAHSMSLNHPVSVAMDHMAELVTEVSEGRMRIDIYPSEQLGTESQSLELLQIGSVDITKVSSSVMERFGRAYRVFSIPYLFRDEAHRFAVLEGEIGRRILLSGEDAWLRGLTYYDAGSRSFYSVDRPIREPADLRGMRVRVQESPLAIQLVNTLGGSATPISFGELYTALQQGVVDAAENNPPSFFSTRHYELSGYFSLNEHTAPADVLIISTHAWNRLSEQEREWVQFAADSSFQYQKELWKTAETEAMEHVRNAGVEIIEPDRSKFFDALQPLYDRVRETQPDVYELFQQIQNLEAEHAD